VITHIGQALLKDDLAQRVRVAGELHPNPYTCGCNDNQGQQGNHKTFNSFHFPLPLLKETA
jgi:hypothetical protein